MTLERLAKAATGDTRRDCIVDGLGLWSDVRILRPVDPRPVLLLDRDGVVNEDTGYVGDPDKVALIDGIAAAIARCNRASIPVAIVSNQSGIARGMFDWRAFAAVQSEIERRLARKGAGVDAVFACAFHEQGKDGFARDHFWRKPRPGMLVAALDALNGIAEQSAMVGDKWSDMEAASAACIGNRFLVSAQARPQGTGGAAAVRRGSEAIDIFLESVCKRRRTGIAGQALC